MFQRFKSALDRTIAEEQARQKAASEQQRTASPSGTSGSRPRSVSRTNSAKDSPAKRKPKKGNQDAANDSAPNPDPAVFEAAFALDEEEAEARESMEKSATQDKVVKEGDDGAANGTDEKSVEKSVEQDQENGEKTDAAPASTADAPAEAPVELPADVKAKLRKLDKLEKTYPGTLPLCYLPNLVYLCLVILTTRVKQSSCAPTESHMAGLPPSNLSNAPCVKTHPSQPSRIRPH
jgi:hypothetical protein